MKNLLAILILSTVSLSVMAEGVPQLKAERAPMKIRKRQARPDVPGHLLIEFGMNLLLNDDPAIETEIMGSRTLNFYYLYDIRIANTKFYFLPGVGVGLDRYKFDEDVTVVRDLNDLGEKVTTFDTISTGGIKKSMLVTNYLDIPLELRFYGNPDDQRRSFKAGIGFKVGMLMSSHTKIKMEQDGDISKLKVKDNFNLTRFRYGVTGRIGVGGFNIFYYQNLTPLFEKDKGPNMTEASNITIGLSFTGF